MEMRSEKQGFQIYGPLSMDYKDEETLDGLILK
jgi:hypothetical protein